VLLYVDDALVIGNQDDVREFIKMLSARFEISEMGPASQYLGVQIERRNNELAIHQTAYLKRVFITQDKHQMRSLKTPIDPGVSKTLRTPSEQASEKAVSKYRSEIGSCMYAMTMTRPELGFAMARLSKHLANPSPRHQGALTNMYRYLNGTIGDGIVYHKDPDSTNYPQVYGYSDSDFANDVETRKSISGYVFILANGAVSWRSKQQDIVTKSSCEAEYVALDSAASEAIWISGLMSELGYPQTAILNGDNRGSIDLAHNPEHHNRTKHIDVRYHWIREKVANKEVELRWVDTNHMIADILTKPLTATKFNVFKEAMGVQKAQLI
jgi:hypothetical protein